MNHEFSPKYLFALIIPLIFESLLNMMIGMADTIMVANCGEAAVSAVSLVDSISVLLIQLFTAFSTGGAVIVSQYLGKRDRESAILSVRNLIYISLVIAVAISALMLIFRGFVIDMVFGSIEDDVRTYTDAYFVPILLSYPALAFFESLTAVSRSEGKTARTMAAAILMNAVNISGNALLIYALDMGPRGAGIASLSSRVLGCLMMFVLMHKKSEKLSIAGLLKGPISPLMIKRILRIAIPAGIESTVFHIGKILVSSTVAYLGTASIAANAVFNALSTFANIPGTAVGMAAVTVIGQCCGARDYKSASYYGKKLLILTYIMMGITSTVMYILTPELAMLYNLSPEANALAISTTRLNMFQTAIFWPFAFTVPNYLRAAGDAKYTMFISIISMWLFRVLLSRILGITLGLGLTGVLWGMFIDWYFRGIMFVIRFVRGAWKSKTVV